MLREYTVFNVDQCENLPPRVIMLANTKPRNRDERDATIDEFLACSGANIREGSGEAYYRPSDDFISLPRFQDFKSAAHFYGTAFHELGHNAEPSVMPRRSGFSRKTRPDRHRHAA
jgi:antirestriction protein ArdC